MSPPDISLADLQPVVPAIILVVAACVLLLTEVFLKTTAAAARAYQPVLTAAAAVAAGAVALANVLQPARPVFQGFGVLDPFSSFLTFIVCVGLALSALSAAGFLRRRGAERGEFYALMLFAAAGMSLLAMSNEFIVIFVNIETMSVATYALTAYLRRGTRPSEAGFKYFILGAFSSAVLLYGAALLFGATGTTKLSDMGAGLLATAFEAQPGLVVIGVVLVAAGFAFKVAAVPFHMWTPDVYEGAPTPVTALMSVGVKAAAFATLVRVFAALGPGISPELPVTLFSVLALLTMVVGNLVALPQRNVKRMLAYSSVAHAGYLLVGVAALFARPEGATSGLQLLGVTAMQPTAPALDVLRNEAVRGILFYLLAYTVTSVGSFALVSALERREDEERGTAWDLERFAGLAQRKPGWAFAMAAFMLSLGGIPPTIGFMGKLFVFKSAVDAGLIGLAVVGVLTSAVSVYYYLRIVVYMFMRPVPETAGALEHTWTTEAVLVLSTIGVVLLGVLPGMVTDWMGPGRALLGF